MIIINNNNNNITIAPRLIKINDYFVFAALVFLLKVIISVILKNEYM